MSGLINIGNIANDGTGDELRVAFRKINQKFNDLDFRIGDTFEVINGGNGIGIFVERVADSDDDSSNNDVLFRSLIAGSNINIQTTTNNEISISAPGTLTTTPFITDSGTYSLTTGNSVSILGGLGISTSTTGNEIIITNEFVSELVEDTTPELGGTLDALNNSIINVQSFTSGSITATSITAPNFYGKLTGSLEGVLTKDLKGFFSEFDFGSLDTNISSFYQFIMQAVDIDFGSVNSPSPLIVDQGGFV